MRDSRISYVIFVFSVIILLLLAFVYADQNKTELRYVSDVEHTYQVIISLHNCELQVFDAESSQRGYLLTGDAHFREAWLAAKGKTDSLLRELRLLISDNPIQRVNLHLLSAAIAERQQLLIENGDPGKYNKDRSFKGRLEMDKIKAYVAMMEKEESQLLVIRSEAKNHYQAVNFRFLKYGFIFVIAICMGALYLIVRELRAKIGAQKILEQNIIDLKRSKEEIEELTFTTSHDLQEPLRKIRTLSTLLNKRYVDSDKRDDNDEKDILNRINRSGERMHELINALLDFSNLLHLPDKKLIDLDLLFTEAAAGIKESTEVMLHHEQTLPSIYGYKQQLLLMFTQLLDNAAKYKHAGRSLEITVQYALITIEEEAERGFWKKGHAKKYHKITITDNGIGFDNSFKEKIFILFQRLHTQNEYSGKGIGLALAKRVMANHYGSIEASAEKDAGASFMLFFPAE